MQSSKALNPKKNRYARRKRPTVVDQHGASKKYSDGSITVFRPVTGRYWNGRMV